MTPAIINPSLYFQFEDDQLVRALGIYVGDLLRAETNDWQTHLDSTFERFETIGNQQAPFTFAGIHITESDNKYTIDQDFYLSKIEQNPSNAEFNKFASLGMEITWITNTRPDTVFEISQI